MEPKFPVSATVKARERALLKQGRWRALDIPVRYGLFRHPRLGPVLIDTGYTERVTSGRRSLALRAYSKALSPRLVPQGQLGSFLAAEGLRPSDVGAVILTHFHADHVAGCRELTNARFYASAIAYEQLRRSNGFSRLRQGVFLELLPEDFSKRLVPFESAAAVEGPLGLGEAFDLFADRTVLITPLPGHAIGHAGVAFPGLQPPLVYAADAEWLKPALIEGRSGLAAALIAHSRVDSRETNARLTDFQKRGGRVILCHDPEPLR